MGIYQNIDKLHLNLGCHIQEFEDGAGLPRHYSDRLAEEINLLLHGCGLFDLKACWLVALQGTDAGTFLQGMVTSDVLQLEVGEIQSSLICSNKGKIIHHLEIFRSHKDEWIVVCDPGEGQAVGTMFDKFHVREDLELRLLNSGEMLRIDLSGPVAENIAENLGYSRGKTEWRFEGASVLTAKFELGELPRLINLVSVSVLQNFIEQVLRNENVDLIGLDAFDEIRVLEGVPRAGVDYGTDNFPQEAGLGDHISFSKGCYIGQEPHARMYHRGHPNWISVWLKIPKYSEIVCGEKLFSDGKEIGEITSLGSFSKDNYCRGIAMIRYEAATEKSLLGLTADGPLLIIHEPLPSTIV